MINISMAIAQNQDADGAKPRWRQSKPRWQRPKTRMAIAKNQAIVKKEEDCNIQKQKG